MRLPQVGECVFIAGNPKSGKTVLSKYLWKKWLPYHQYGIILQVDYDGGDPWERYANETLSPNLGAETYRDELKRTKTICVDATNVPLDELKPLWNRLLGVALALGHTLVVCDEISRVTETTSIMPNHGLMITGRGRKRLCSMIQATQRLQKCSMDVRTLSQHKFIFRLDDRDVIRYASTFMKGSERILTLKPYYCLYSRQDEGGRTVVEVLPPCPL